MRFFMSPNMVISLDDHHVRSSHKDARGVARSNNPKKAKSFGANIDKV